MRIAEQRGRRGGSFVLRNSSSHGSHDRDERREMGPIIESQESMTAKKRNDDDEEEGREEPKERAVRHFRQTRGINIFSAIVLAYLVKT